MKTYICNNEQIPNMDPFIVVKYAIFGPLAGILPIYILTIIANIIGDGVANTLMFALPALVLFITYGAILSFIPALFTGIAVHYATKHNHIKGIMHPISIGFIVSMLYGVILAMIIQESMLEMILTFSTTIAPIGAFASFIVNRFFIRHVKR